MIRERPILFNTEMVRAILEGRKTQARRVINLPKWAKNEDENEVFYHLKKNLGIAFYQDGKPIKNYSCPYGIPGDWLWVRENYWICEVRGGGLGNPFLVYSADVNGPSSFNIITNSINNKTHPIGIDFAEGHGRAYGFRDKMFYQIPKWGHHPSIHMPKWAARIWLKVVNIQVERIQDISEDDVIREGGSEADLNSIHSFMEFKSTCPIEAFSFGWDKINAKRGHSWESNPWVWVIEFKILSTNGRPADD